jgi:hypothetical protein
VLTLSRKYQNNKAQELMVALTEQGDKITTLLDQATAQNHQQVQTSSQRAGAAYDNALSQLILTIVIVLVGLMLLGGWLFWQIRHGIRSAVSTISRIETIEQTKQYASQNLIVRSPQYCRRLGTQTCEVCAGKALSKFPTGLPIPLMEVSGGILTDSLKLMHNTALVTEEMNLSSVIT